MDAFKEADDYMAEVGRILAARPNEPVKPLKRSPGSPYVLDAHGDLWLDCGEAGWAHKGNVFQEE